MLLMTRRGAFVCGGSIFSDFMKPQTYLLALLVILASCEREPIPDRDNEAARKSTTSSDMIGVYPPKLIREDGAYEMIAMIEGVEPNKRFVANLRLVERQRALIREKRKGFPEGTDFSDEAFRETEPGKELTQIEQSLIKNAEFMVKNYGYVLGQDYLLIPIECDLFEEKVKDGEKSKVLVKEIRSGGSYERFQDLRNRYTEAKKKENREEALRLSAELRKEFSFDVEMKYNMDIRKSLLYRKLTQ
jgi:hypothetical protein